MYRETPSSGLGGSDYLAVRLDGLDGREMWRASGGGGWLNSVNADAYVRDSVCAIAADGLGDVVIAGNTEGALFVSTGEGFISREFIVQMLSDGPDRSQKYSNINVFQPKPMCNST